MFPLGTTRKVARTPVVTLGLIAVNVLVFLWQTTLSTPELRQLYQQAAFIPCQANLFGPETYIDAFRAMFLHGGWTHLIGNMLFLYIFGPNVEEYFGRGRFLLFYLVAGYAASFTHLLFNQTVCAPSLGASGAIYGIMGAFFLLYPATRIRTVTLFWRIPIGIGSVQAFYMLLYFFIVDFINGIGSLSVDTTATTGVAFWAHIGGFLAGLVVTFFMLVIKPAPPVDAFEYLDG
ncbi:MAG: rhomboid family intramembrane serine protease [Anaerolineae bacterium]